jgi:hypothetical protein
VTCTVQGVAPSQQAMRDALEAVRQDQHLTLKAVSLRFAPGDYRLDEHDGVFMTGPNEARALLAKAAPADLRPAEGAARAATRVEKNAWDEADTAIAVLALAFVAGIRDRRVRAAPLLHLGARGGVRRFFRHARVTATTAMHATQLGPMGNMENQVGLILIGFEGLAFLVIGVMAWGCIFLAIWLGKIVGWVGRRIFARPVRATRQAAP